MRLYSSTIFMFVCMFSLRTLADFHLGVLFSNNTNTSEDFDVTEKRVVTCLDRGSDSCRPMNYVLPSNLSCRTEPMPFTGGSSHRRACPLNCATAERLSVMMKTPHSNRNCLKFYNYGNYRD